MELPMGAINHETSQERTACATVQKLLQLYMGSPDVHVVPVEGVPYHLAGGVHVYFEGDTIGSFELAGD